jgi:indole-3-glycerol phosphate synthase
MEHLDSIVRDVKRRLEERRQAMPLYRLRALAAPQEAASFLEAVRGPAIALVPEVRRISSTEGLLRPDLDVRELVARFEAAGAAAVSVVTETDHFRGSLDDLSAAIRTTRLPVLQKDFLVDEYQLHEARALGASAVLLTVAILAHDELLALGETARRLALDVVVAARDEIELEQALMLDGAVIAVGAPEGLDLERASLENTFRLTSQVPADRVVLAQGAVNERDEILRLQAAGVDGVILGEHLLSQDDVEAALRHLLPE